MRLRHEFVELVPDRLAPGVVYVCIRYKTASHLCACGCGREVVTPFSPAGWTLAFDGETVSLSPSIGNWKFPCQSHYWIRQDRVQWAGGMSPEGIAEVERNDQDAVRRRHERPAAEAPRVLAANERPLAQGRWARFKKRWLRW